MKSIMFFQKLGLVVFPILWLPNFMQKIRNRTDELYWRSCIAIRQMDQQTHKYRTFQKITCQNEYFSPPLNKLLFLFGLNPSFLEKNSSTPLQWDLSVILRNCYSSDKLLKQINKFIANVTHFSQSSFFTGYAKYRLQLFQIYRFKTYLLNLFQEN